MLNYSLRYIHAYSELGYCTFFQVQLQEVVGRVVAAMTSDSYDRNLWRLYFNDFIIHKLKLMDPDRQSKIAQELLYTYFHELHNKETLQRLVELHCHTSIYHLSLAQVATTLRPLGRIEVSEA